MLWAEDDGADQAGQLRPGQPLVQVQVAVFVSIHQAFGLQVGGSDLLGAGGLRCLSGSGQQGRGHGSGQEQGCQVSLFHARFLLFGYDWGLATRTISQTLAKVEANRHTTRKNGRQVYLVTAVTHQR